jgi:hypothetical protein
MAARFGSSFLRVAYALGAALLPAACCASVLEFSVSTSKTQVRPGEALDYHVTARNPTPSPVTLGFPTSIQAQVKLDQGYWRPSIGTTALTSATIPASGSKTWTFREGAWGEIGLGTHEVLGRVVHFPEVGPVTFDVVPPVYPTESFTIDFDNVPGTSERMRSLTELWRFGVRFSSRFDRNGSGANYLTPTPGVYTVRNGTIDGVGPGATGNQFCGIMTTTYPPGFNIVADFDVPVYGATVDVGGGVGRTMTMIAKDAAGQVLASVTSSPIPAYPEFVGPLSLTTHSPIATLEWWPSSTNASVLLDNLYLDLTPSPEPSAAAVMGAAAAAALLARRRKP